MWFYNGAKVKYLVNHTKTAVAITYKINPTQITKIIAENTKNLSYSVSNTIESIKLKIVRNSHLLLGKIGTFLKCHVYCCTNSVNCSYTKASKRQQLITHTSIVKESTIKCYKHASLLSKCTLLCPLVI